MNSQWTLWLVAALVWGASVSATEVVELRLFPGKRKNEVHLQSEKSCETIYSRWSQFYFSNAQEAKVVEVLKKSKNHPYKMGKTFRLSPRHLVAVDSLEMYNSRSQNITPISMGGQKVVRVYRQEPNVVFPIIRHCSRKGTCDRVLIPRTSLSPITDRTFKLRQVERRYKNIDLVEGFIDSEIKIVKSKKGYKHLKCCFAGKCDTYTAFALKGPTSVKEVAFSPLSLAAFKLLQVDCPKGECRYQYDNIIGRFSPDRELNAILPVDQLNFDSQLAKNWEFYTRDPKVQSMQNFAVEKAGQRPPKGQCLRFVKQSLIDGGYINYHIGWDFDKDEAVCPGEICTYKTKLSAQYFGPWLQALGFVDILKNEQDRKLIRSPYDAPYGCIVLYEGHFKTVCKGKGKKRRCYRRGTDRNSKHGHIEIRHQPGWYEGLSSVWMTDNVKTQDFCRDQIEAGTDKCCKPAKAKTVKQCRRAKGSKKRSCKTHTIHQMTCLTDGFVSDFKRPYARSDWRHKCYRGKYPSSGECKGFDPNASNNYYSGSNRTMSEIYCRTAEAL